MPELRVGTLDSLMVLSDDLVKVNALVEAVVNKVRRQLFELSSTTGDEMGEVLVEGSTPEAYLERFAWDEAKYPPRRPLKETVEAITETIQQLEDNLKVRVWCCAACFATLVPSVCVQAALWVCGRHPAPTRQVHAPLCKEKAVCVGPQIRVSEFNQVKGQVSALKP